MKGPYERLKYDLRRLWECPQCKRRERTDGGVTFRFCQCQAKEGDQPIVMRLVADGAQRLVPVIAQPRPERVEPVLVEEGIAESPAELPVASPNDNISPESAGENSTSP
jgi:hypothetical protein